MSNLTRGGYAKNWANPRASANHKGIRYFLYVSLDYNIMHVVLQLSHRPGRPIQTLSRTKRFQLVQSVMNS